MLSWVAVVGVPQLPYVNELARVVVPSVLTRSRLQTNPGRDAAMNFGRTLAKAFGLRVRF